MVIKMQQTCSHAFLLKLTASSVVFRCSIFKLSTIVFSIAAE